MRSSPICGAIVLLALAAPSVSAAGGSLTLKVHEESDDEPTITRLEMTRAGSPTKRIPIRKTVPAGIGVVLDRTLELSLPDAVYQFRMVRGPEYRIISGNFTLEKTSLDTHAVQLPRMVNMFQEGWTSGDCCLPASAYSLPLRMAAEDLHVAAVLGHVEAKPIPGRDRDDRVVNDPTWIREDTRCSGGLVFYGLPDESASSNGVTLPVERLVEVARMDSAAVAIENPFAWPVPVWLASGQIDGVFVLGDWLRLDRKVMRVKEGREPQGPTFADEKTVGRWAEQIYWNMLEAGLRIAPLAGSGDQSGATPIGYNRLYVAEPVQEYEPDAQQPLRRVATAKGWWYSAWRGHSVATNGPLLRPKLGGKIPGHVFEATSGQVLQLQPELTLAVRDQVEYLEVVRNGTVHYSARLDEFARAGGVIPPIQFRESGWVTIRVVTLYEDHFRAAMSAPWYIEFDSRPRIASEGVEFFRRWLAEYEQRLRQLPPEALKQHVPYVRGARAFWAKRAASVNQ